MQIAAKINKTFCSLFFNSSISLRKAWFSFCSLSLPAILNGFQNTQVQDKRRIRELRSENTEHVCTAQCTRVLIHHHDDHHNSIVLPPHPPPAYCFYCIRNAQKEKIMTIHRFFSWDTDKRLWRRDVNVFHRTMMWLHHKKRIIHAPYDSFHYNVVEQSYMFSFKPLILY